MTLDNGTVIQVTRNGKSSYWKILNVRSLFREGDESYGVIRCSKKGKSFREQNGFRKLWIDKAVETGEVKVMATGTIGDKANIEDGIRIGKKKRRVGFLKARIEYDTAELERLKKELGL